MGTPSPELKQLWIRVLKRIHPDLAVDEQDRVRCELLTKLANEAYQAGDVEGLKAVLRPSQPSTAGRLRTYKRSTQWQPAAPPSPAEPKVQQASPAPEVPPQRSFQWWFRFTRFSPDTAFALKRLVPVAIAVLIVIGGGFSIYSMTTRQHGVPNSPATQVSRVSAPMNARVEVPDAGIWHPPPSRWYGDEIHNRISRNLNPSAVANTPAGATAVIAFTVTREGFPHKVSVFTTSGYASLDSSCVNAVRQVGTFGPPEGATEEDSLNVLYHCSYPLQEGQQAPQQTSAPAANSAEPSHLYMKQMGERLYQSFSDYERVDANVPAGNSAEMWFDVNRDGSLSNVRIGKPSGWDSLDYACKRAVQRTETVGALPEDYKLRTLPASFACSYNGSNALKTSRPVDSAVDRPDLYVGSIRNTTHE